MRLAPSRRRRTRVLAVLLCALAASCSARDGALAAATAKVERGRIERIVVATGTIEPEREVEIRSRVPGIIERIHVKAGDKVEPGALLIELERELIASQVKEARAALDAAGVELRFAEIALRRADGLQKRGASSEQALDDARARHQTATASRARAAASLESLEVQLRYANITAPLSGSVLDVFVEEGSAVSPVTSVTGGTLLASLAATHSVHLEGLVDENEVSRLQIGQRARVRTEAFGERRFAGHLREIAPLGKRIQNVTYFEVEIEIEDPNVPLLRARMSGDAEIVTEVVEDALVIPDTALRYSGERVFVRVAGEDPDEPGEERDVTTGIVEEGRVQIESGLSEGEVVVLQ